VAKKKAANKSSNDSPEVHEADEAVRLAEAELKKAQAAYVKIRQEATDRLKRVREKTLGDLIDDLLAQVKKHPGPGVVIAMLAGLFLGRIFRR